MTFDAGFLRGRHPEFDVGADAFGEFLGRGPLCFEANLGESLDGGGLGQDIAQQLRQLRNDFWRRIFRGGQARPRRDVTEIEALLLYRRKA